MTLKSLLINTFLILLISSISLAIYYKCCEKKLAYVEIKKVFNGFEMKKELEEKFKQTAETRQKLLDSLSLNLKILSKQLNLEKDVKSDNKELQEQFEYRREEFFKLKTQFAEDNQALSQKYDAQIFERLTQYILEYGKKHNYDYIFGADGNGNLMYASEQKNISEEVSEFVNNKYKGVE